MRTRWLFLVLLAFPLRANAQDDYRNLDRNRPISTEDAFPVEQGAFEVMVPWSYEREGGESGLMFEPEFMWGIFDKAMVGMGAPILLGDEGGLAGLRPFAFYNVFGEGRRPAFAVRLDMTTPVGALGGERPIGMLTFILTQSFGATRLHANGGRSIGSADGPLEDHPPHGAVSLGVDHTVRRHRAVIMADIQRNVVSDESWWVVGAGIRMQATPAMVFDIGMQRRLSALGPDLVITAGLTKSFANAH